MTVEQDLGENLDALVPNRERRGRPPMIAVQAVRIDREVWAVAGELRSLGKARRRIAREHGITFDHVRKLQRLAVIGYLHDSAEAQLEELWISEPAEMLIAAE